MHGRFSQLTEPPQVRQLRRGSVPASGPPLENPVPCGLTRKYLTICPLLNNDHLAYNFTRHSERNLVRERRRIVSRLVPCDQDAVPSSAYCQFLEDLHGFIKALIQSAPARDMDIDGVKEGGHGVSFSVGYDCIGYFEIPSPL